MDSIQLDSMQRWREVRQHLDNALNQLNQATNALYNTLSDYTDDVELFEKAATEADEYSHSAYENRESRGDSCHLEQNPQ